MPKPTQSGTRQRQSRISDLFVRADKFAEDGNFKAAFRLFLTAAKLGDRSCQVNVGNLYDDGKGVRRNRSAAMYWYKRAYRRGEASAASNIGVMWRNEKKYSRALDWFKKAAKLGDDEANLDIAKLYLAVEYKPAKAIPYLRRVCSSRRVTEAGLTEAKALLIRAKDMHGTGRLRLTYLPGFVVLDLDHA